MSKRVAASLLAAPLLPLAGGRGSDLSSSASDPIERELQAAIKRVGAAAALRALQEGKPLSEAQVPQPATVRDTIELSREAREAAKESAELARETAEEERQRRMEAEERASGAFEAGQKEAENRWSAILEMFKSSQDAILKLIQDKHATEVAAERSRAEQIAERMEAANRQLMDSLTKEIQRRDERIASLEQQLKELGSRETFEGWFAKTILSGAADDPKLETLRRVFGGFGGPAALTPEQEANREWIVGQVKERLAKMRQERDSDAALKGEFRELIRTATGVVGSLKEHLPLLVGAPRMPGSSVPEDGWEEPPAEKAAPQA